MTSPVFFDPSGRRRRWTVRSLALALLGVVLAAALFATTIVDVPTPAPLPVAVENAHPVPLRIRAQRLVHGIGRLFRRGSAGADPPQTRLGFYVPWDTASAASLARHLGQLDAVSPALIMLSGPGATPRLVDDHRFAAIVAHAPHKLAVLPMVQNLAGGRWETAATSAMLADPARRHALAGTLAGYVRRGGAAGLVFDLESLPPAALRGYRALLADEHALLAPAHRLVEVTVPAGDAVWTPRAMARFADRIILMDYDEHWQGGEAGPIASQPWFEAQLRDALAAVGRARLIVALGSYAYDWNGGHADALTLEEAWLAAHDSQAVPRFDAASANSGFSYDDDAGGRHVVWMLDAAASWNEMLALRATGVSGVALWRLGSEDAGFWNDLAAWRAGRSIVPRLEDLAQASNVDVEGAGEILRIGDTPTPGRREVLFDAASQAVTAERYAALPTPYVVRRTGAQAHQVALTFDDGPDPDWTPRILSILERTHAPATFFVIGENGLTAPQLLRRIVADGDEIGNHSYTHPNLAEASPRTTALELNATQRLVEAYTGHAMRLFRAPYFGDAEPTTADELNPAMVAQRLGYTIVGLHVDPADWKRPSADQIVARTLAGVAAATPDRSGNVVLLHDGGGDRANTVAALPRIIAGLRARGIELVPISRLAHLTHRQVMPEVAGADLAAVRADVALFALLAGIEIIFKWLFFFAIALGIARALAMTALALWNRARAARPPARTAAELVSVIIPAFNEERVIERSIRRVLASDHPQIEVIVADDGSRDRTGDIVHTAFGDDPRVRLLTLSNGGKAAALNRALAIARGAVIVALDADTQFETTTIGRLVRWFADPAVGAVAGNAKVGNRVNLVTRWQAVEYVTAQNVERRALAAFDAITVVPGAVGAWRRAALDAVGGYPEDTLAEDQDLTIAVQRAGWRIAYDVEAVAWTEAPETMRALGKQRYRWAFGTLQCLWKHRAILKRRDPAGLAYVGLPQAWLFQIGFAAISPVIDFALVFSAFATVARVQAHGWAQTEGDVLRMAVYWLAFTAIDLACGWIAYRMEPRERRFPALLLLAQRVVYRQLMYSVVLRAIGAAVRGGWVGWGKLERSGRVADVSA